jgi:hypothetical protein
VCHDIEANIRKLHQHEIATLEKQLAQARSRIDSMEKIHVCVCVCARERERERVRARERERVREGGRAKERGREGG